MTHHPEQKVRYTLVADVTGLLLLVKEKHNSGYAFEAQLPLQRG